MDIIEISSSPEPVPKLRRKLRAAAASEIIEISDSDTEESKQRSVKKQKAKAAPEAGPSRPRRAHSSQPKAGPSEPKAKKGKGRAVDPRPLPLFLPEDDETAPGDPGASQHIDPPHSRSPSPRPAGSPAPRAETPAPVPSCLSQVLEIIPDVEPAHVVSLIEPLLEVRNAKGEERNDEVIVQAVLHNLFERGDYPKVDRKGKGRDMSGSGSGKRGAGADVNEGDEPAKKKAKLDSGWSFEDLDGSEGEIDCGCCFTPYPFNKLIQCPEAHLFCTDCMTNYVSNLLGMQDPNIKCMDQSGCKEHFTEGELRRFMSPKLLELYEKVRMRREIESAQLEGLEECPYCEYKVVIESAEEKLFRCENKECGAVTCRFCKKDDHLPKSCKEVEDDKKIDARHAVEEAMTKALMRNCPKCQKAFIKEYGCNKMTCPYCRTLSCYICRQIITGYEHFAHPPPYTGRQDSNKCALWDPVEKRHSDEVAEARKKAIEQTKLANPDVDEKDLQVDLPPPPPAAAAAAPAGLPVYHHVPLPARIPPPPPLPRALLMMQQMRQQRGGPHVLAPPLPPPAVQLRDAFDLRFGVGGRAPEVVVRAPNRRARAPRPAAARPKRVR